MDFNINFYQRYFSDFKKNIMNLVALKNLFWYNPVFDSWEKLKP